MKMKNIFLLTTVFIAQNFLYSSDKDFKLGTIELHGNQEITKKSDKDVLIEDIMSQTSNFSVSNECKGASFLLSPIGGVVSLSTSLTDILGRLSLGNTISSFFLPASNMLISSIFVKFSCFDYMNQEKKKKLSKKRYSNLNKIGLATFFTISIFYSLFFFLYIKPLSAKKSLLLKAYAYAYAYAISYKL